MFVKNDPSPEKRYYNGMIGEITSIDEDGFTVHTKEKNEKSLSNLRNGQTANMC